ncbi:MAG: peptide deformylase [Patescibacteria group bacterium]|jgi:peptide deformylase
MTLTIRTYPDPVLTAPATKVREFTEELRRLADAMISLMRQADGMGLAAPQVGQSIRLIVLEHTPGATEDQADTVPLQVLVNPKIISSSRDTDLMEEGCLSLPGIEVPIKRPTKVKVRAQDLDGNIVQFRASGLHARIVQHEIDHLDGRLIWDHSADRDAHIAAYAKRHGGPAGPVTL